MNSIEEVKAIFARNGVSISEWARQNGFSPNMVHAVLGGRIQCKRGQSHKIAVKLGLKEGVIEDMETFCTRMATRSDSA